MNGINSFLLLVDEGREETSAFCEKADNKPHITKCLSTFIKATYSSDLAFVFHFPPYFKHASDCMLYHSFGSHTFYFWNCLDDQQASCHRITGKRKATALQEQEKGE